jgi:hypothetical protein
MSSWRRARCSSCPPASSYCPRADEEALIMVIEPQETAASGDAAGHVESG